MLTGLLRAKGHEVISWIENCSLEGNKNFEFEKWVHTKEAHECFVFDTDGATKSDLVIYYGPAGKDACAEVGAAWASSVLVIGLYAKGEDLGLMRKMMHDWTNSVADLMQMVAQYQLIINNKLVPL